MLVFSHLSNVMSFERRVRLDATFAYSVIGAMNQNFLI